MTPKDLSDLAGRTCFPDAVDERPSVLILRADLSAGPVREAWTALRREPGPFLVSVTISEADGDGQLAYGAEPMPGQVFRITAEKAVADGELRLFFGRSLASLADALGEAGRVRVADMLPAEAFATYRSEAVPWRAEEFQAPRAPVTMPDPRGLTRDFTARGAVPPDITPWLLQSPPLAEGDAYRNWTALAAPRLMAALADQVSSVGTAVHYHFSGPPTCRFEVTHARLLELFPALTAGAAWVFAEGVRDADTRHLLLANEWARSWRADAQASLGAGSLDSARAAYGAYVKSSSKETLKALADLRKTVIEETQKISQRAQDLSASLWKDLAVASAPFVLKILSDAARASSQSVAGGLAVAAAVFLVFSFFMQVHINRRFFRAQKSARAVWRTALNSVLSPAEVEEFSDRPIKVSIKDYRRVRLFVGMFYALLVTVLLAFAWFSLDPMTR